MFYPATAYATYSIVAVDRATGQVGGAGASCVGSFSVRNIYGVAPGYGAVHAQASLSTAGRNRAVLRLFEGTDPADIIAEITSPAFDPSAGVRQYGVVDLMGRAAGFTGRQTTSYTEDRQGSVDSYTYSMQGNILTSRLVLDYAEIAFQGLGCDLADKLMWALEFGALFGEGDRRCTPRGIPADSAFIEVELPEGEGTFLRFEVTASGPYDPVAWLRALYDVWRAENPCPVPAK